MDLSHPIRRVKALVHLAMAAAHELSRGKLARRQVAGLAIVLLCSALARASKVHADDVDAERAPPSEALDHYNRGRAHYQAGRYREAVVELEAALALDPGSPNLVYNLARVHELLGDIEPAIGYYERYHSMLPPNESEERQRVMGAIQRLRGAQQHVVRPSEVPVGTVPVVATERGVADGAFWTVATLSLAAFVAGGVTGGLALREEKSARDFVLGADGDRKEQLALADKADRLALASDASMAFGAVSGLTAILLFALRTKPVMQTGLAPHTPSIFQASVVPTASGWTLSLRGSL